MFINLSKEKLPRHVSILMDGNRRWAKKQGLSIFKGHSYVADELLERLVDRAIKREIEYLSLWAFSTENWKRERKEVKALMGIFRRSLKRSMVELDKKGVRFKVIGDLRKFPEDIQRDVKKWVRETQKNEKITVVLALNYGGRDEIVRAVRRMISNEKVKSKKLKVTEEIVKEYLDTAGMPDPDLIIRPGGEKRLSGFMSWQSAYSELYFTDVLMPDFDEREFDNALKDYSERKRRFGK